jgi:serine/threonine protein kinase
MPLSAGDRLGRYEILAPIGAGGMGEVYRAHDERLDRDVAIKVLPASVAQDPDRLGRFEREAKAVARLDHPNILAIHAFGTQDRVTYSVTELLEGETLRERLEAGAVMPADSKSSQTFHGIHLHAHRQAVSSGASAASEESAWRDRAASTLPPPRFLIAHYVRSSE